MRLLAGLATVLVIWIEFGDSCLCLIAGLTALLTLLLAGLEIGYLLISARLRAAAQSGRELNSTGPG